MADALHIACLALEQLRVIPLIRSEASNRPKTYAILSPGHWSTWLEVRCARLQFSPEVFRLNAMVSGNIWHSQVHLVGPRTFGNYCFRLGFLVDVVCTLLVNWFHFSNPSFLVIG
jgi:hypothetical protein